MVKVSVFLLLLLNCAYAADRYLQIIHSNDLHSYYMGERSGKGGFARLNSLSNFLIDSFEGASLRLDAGDFADGTSFSIPDSGRMSFKLLEAMGIEGAVVGNHDYLHGIGVLKENISMNRKTIFLAANLDKKAKSILGTSVVSSHVFFKGGMRIGVIGLSTPHILYQHQWRQGKLVKALVPLKREIKILKEDGADVILLLSHLGLEKDLQIVKAVSGLDAIIGGHSHEPLFKPLLRRDKSNRIIPIFQAGAHGLYLGKIAMRIDDEGAVTLDSYELFEVGPSLPEDPLVASLVNQQLSLRNQYLEEIDDGFEVISKMPLGGMRDGKPGKKVEWSEVFLNRILKDTQANLVLWSNSFFGEEIPAGPVTMLDIIDNLPRTDRQSMPWVFKEFSLRPIELKLLLSLVKHLPKSWGVTWIHKETRDSRVIIPNEIFEALQRTFPWFKIFPHKELKISIWETAIRAVPQV